MSRKAAPSEHELILDNRETALRIVRSLMRRWGVYLESDDIQSLTDLALCEAAKRFKPSKGVKFVTYLFHFLRGTLIHEIKGRKRSQAVILESTLETRGAAGNDESRSRNAGEILTAVAANDALVTEESPERLTYLNELRVHCEAAMKSLTPLEREAVVGIHYFETKVAKFAREIGYSRGHVSAVRRQAFDKLRPQLEPLAA